jgi:glucose/arabinose dehydrogenase
VWLPNRLAALSLVLVVAATSLAGLALAGTLRGEEPEPLPPARESGRAHHFEVERIAAGLNRPTWVGAAPGDTDALWVLTQPGRVLRLEGGETQTVLDLGQRVRTGAEQGLLGIAFHPDFAENRRLYLHWSDRRGATRVAEFHLGGDGTVDPRERRPLLHLDQPEENHNGGQLAFGPDGRLHLGLGDGGGAFDPRGNAQDPESLLGKLVSADVEERRPRWRVELTGLRNPWRFWFDPALAEVWIGDVGQDRIEEVNRVRLEPDEAPKNLGWGAYEGAERTSAGHELDESGELVWPVAAYGRTDGCSVIGGPVYRGAALPGLSGRYVYGDFCSGHLWSLRPTPEGRAADVRRERVRLPQLTHVGTDADGEIVLASAAGHVYRAVASASR